ncbi:MAG: ornithine cyclodeaminase family protein [Pseudomonadota bacterium]
MISLNAEQTQACLPWQELVAALREGFVQGCESPARHHHDFSIPDEDNGTLLLMPAWTEGEHLGVKQVLVIPGNGQRGLSAVSASYQLSSARTGEVLALLEGGVLTNRRTAAASALASGYLSRADASHLLMVGTGGLARDLIPAHAAIRPITQVSIWGRNPDHSSKLADEIAATGLSATVVSDLQSITKEADIVSCATLAEQPLIYGDWLSEGTHVDLVGAFKPTMRESDDRLMQRAEIFVDTREGALSEGGDIIQPMQAGAIAESDIRADLYELCRGAHPGRTADAQITVFKSVGTALEDLAAAKLAYQLALS